MPAFYPGEIALFAFSAIPAGYAQCAGQVWKIQSYPKLFAVIHNTYGGDGQTTFALPDLRGVAVIGTGTGLHVGQTLGSASVQLSVDQIPNHPHTWFADAATPAIQNSIAPNGAVLGQAMVLDPNTSDEELMYMYVPQTNGNKLSPQAIGLNGGGEGHPNMMPSLGLAYCIAVGQVSAE